MPVIDGRWVGRDRLPRVPNLNDPDADGIGDGQGPFSSDERDIQEAEQEQAKVKRAAAGIEPHEVEGLEQQAINQADVTSADGQRDHTGVAGAADQTGPRKRGRPTNAELADKRAAAEAARNAATGEPDEDSIIPAEDSRKKTLPPADREDGANPSTPGPGSIAVDSGDDDEAESSDEPARDGESPSTTEDAGDDSSVTDDTTEEPTLGLADLVALGSDQEPGARTSR